MYESFSNNFGPKRIHSMHPWLYSSLFSFDYISLTTFSFNINYKAYSRGIWRDIGGHEKIGKGVDEEIRRWGDWYISRHIQFMCNCLTPRILLLFAKLLGMSISKFLRQEEFHFVFLFFVSIHFAFSSGLQERRTSAATMPTKAERTRSTAEICMAD